MKPVRLAAAATLALPRWALLGLGMLYILPGLIGRELWKDDAASFGIMWTMANGGWADWLLPNLAGQPVPEEGPLAFWLGALCIKLFGGLVGDVMASRVSTIGIFVLGTMSLWYTAFHLGRRPEAQPLRLAFGGQPEPDDYGRTLADTAVLFYLGCLGLLVLSHETLAVTLHGSLLAYFLYRAVRYVERPCIRNGVLIGIALGGLVLSRGLFTPLAVLLALLLCTRMLAMPLAPTLQHLGLSVLVAGAVSALWLAPAALALPYGMNPIHAWLAWHASQFGLPSWSTLRNFFRVGGWFFWPAWPFAAWAIYAWRRQHNMLHIVLPLSFVGALALLIVCDPVLENGDLLKLLPPLALMAAFGLPTMKRGAINAIDWFSVMVLTMTASVLWLFFAAKLTGWPAQFAKNLLKLVPGHVPAFGPVAFAVAAAASIGWIALVYWRISRQPPVLWRAVVLSSGGLIMIWVLLTTLFMPEINYHKSYASVARQIASALPAGSQCIETNVGLPQRTSLVYFGKLPFARVDAPYDCGLVLLQDSLKKRDGNSVLKPYAGEALQLIWEGGRPTDRDERFRLYQRKRQP